MSAVIWPLSRRNARRGSSRVPRGVIERWPQRQGQQLVSTAMVPPPVDTPPPPPPPPGGTSKRQCDRPPAGWTCPGECGYCDAHPDWQELRRLWGIAFTGHAPKVDVERPWLSEVLCPSDARRPDGANHVWPGNQPATP